MKGICELMERFTVSLDDFIKYLMKKWKIVLTVILLVAVSFVFSAAFLGNKITIPPNEDYENLKEQEKSFETYIDNSPLMKIDSTNVYERIIYISEIIDRESLKNYVEAGHVWDDWDDENFRHYFSDLVTWYDSTVQSAEIKIQYYEEEECEKLAKHLVEQLYRYDNELKVLLGDALVSRDETIADVQTWYVNRLNDIQGQLEHTAAGYTIEVTVPTAVVIGAMAGTILSIVCLFLMFLYGKKEV